METNLMGYMGSCQNYGPFLGELIQLIQERILSSKAWFGFKDYSCTA